MEKELLELVQKNLPEMAAKEFATYFKQSEAMKLELNHEKEMAIKFQENYDAMCKINQDLNSQNNELTRQNDEWKARAENIEAREKNADIFKLEIELNAVKQVNSVYIQMTDRLLTNTIIRENIQKHIAVEGGERDNGYYDNNGRPIMSKAAGSAVPVVEVVEKTTA